MKLSIIIPVFNEEKTISDILKKVLQVNVPGVEKEIIVVDDGSTDATASAISNINPFDKLRVVFDPEAQTRRDAERSRSIKYQISNIKIVHHRKNQGKGAAVRTGINNSSGDYILIQDADLEYNPKDIPRLIAPILNGNAEVVYGTRLRRLPNFFRDERTPRFFMHYIGNRLLSFITSILYGQWITDMETCYKLFPKKALDNIKLNSKKFDLEPEMTAKLLKKGIKITEVPIATNPRGYKEGKKLRTFKDGSIALWTLLKYRLVD